MKKSTPMNQDTSIVSVLREENAHLRELIRKIQDQNEKLQEKLIVFSGDAADRYHRLQMTQAAQMRPSLMGDMIPVQEMNQMNPEDKDLNEFMKGFGL